MFFSSRILSARVLAWAWLVAAAPFAYAQTDRVSVKKLLAADGQFLADVVDRLSEDEAKSLPASAAARKANAAATTPSKSELTSRIVETAADSTMSASLKSQERAALVELLSDAQVATLMPQVQAVLGDRTAACGDKRPAIHNIGWLPTLTFERSTADRPKDAGERAIRVPVEGYDLDPLCTNVTVQVDGTVPVSRYGSSPAPKGKPDFFVTKPTGELKDGLNVLLLEPYVDRLKTGDKVTISVLASNRYPKRDGTGNRRVAVSKRVFTVYEADDFRRQVLSTRVAPHDIAAFPLPEHEAQALFGTLVSTNYFVVRLSVRNTEANAKLISTGMIRATGTALVDPKDPTESSFSVPVSVIPHSLQQIYTVITDEEVNQPRHQTFRALEFFGALAAAAQGVGSFGIQAAKNVAFLTGIVIPEGKKLWPDRWPGYERNIVNYAMPDLMKVPANSVVDHKFLFFSKREIDGLVSDPNLFSATTNGTTRSFGDRATSKPEAFVIALAFDNLDIRFENVFATPTFGARDQLRDAVAALSAVQGDLDAQRGWISANGKSSSFFGLSSQERTTRETDFKKLAQLKSTDPTLDSPKKHAAFLVKLIDATTPGAPGAAPPKTVLVTDLYGTGKYGLDAMIALRTRSNELSQRMNSGVDGELLRDEVSDVEKAVKTSRDVIVFYKGAVDTIKKAGDPVAAILAKVKADGSVDAGDKNAVTAADTVLDELIVALRKQKPEASQFALD